MPPRIPDISGSMIVLVGSFNPKIFQPEWFARQNLLPPGEAEAAEIKLMIPQVAQIETERFSMQVTDQQFIAASKPNANPLPLRDLVHGTFLILEHTPVTAMGLNFQMHFGIESREEWHRVGDMLVPKEGWNQVLEGRPGMLSLTILTNKTEPEGAQFRVKVEPSIHVNPGVYFETNEHYPASGNDALQRLMGILSQRWEEANIYANRVAEHMLTWAAAAR